MPDKKQEQAKVEPTTRKDKPVRNPLTVDQILGVDEINDLINNTIDAVPNIEDLIIIFTDKRDGMVYHAGTSETMASKAHWMLDTVDDRVMHPKFEEIENEEDE